MKFLLDTNICIYLLKGRAPEAVQIAQRFNTMDCALSVMTEFELEYGCRKSQRNASYRALLSGFLGSLQILPFERDDALAAAGQRAALEAIGQTIGPYDLLIAAQALSRGLTLVTNNEREFRRIKGLRVENWALKATR